MSDLHQQQSPLIQIKLAEPAAKAPTIREIPFQGFLNIRGKPNNALFLAAVDSALECSLPLEPNTVTESDHYKVYWLGPDEWLVITASEQQQTLLSKLERALTGIFSSVTDNSSGLTLLNISGENAAELLAKGCPLDLHPRAFKPGQCAQTRLAKAGMTLSPLADHRGFELIIRRSFADYILLWLQQASIEFSVALKNS